MDSMLELAGLTRGGTGLSGCMRGWRSPLKRGSGEVQLAREAVVYFESTG
jgi:hypothetical protein